MKREVGLLILMWLTALFCGAQTSTPASTASPDQLSAGLGIGLDYGGFGANLLYYPQKNIGLFAGGGWALTGFGYNVGLKLRLLGKKGKISPYALAMYGYNAALLVENAEQYNKLFYGPSFGAGIDFKFKQASKGYWSVALLFPVRGTQVDDYLDELKTKYMIEMKSELLPIAFSLGYHFVIK